MQDEPIVRRFADVMGVGKVYAINRGNGKVAWAWQTTTIADFKRALVMLYPWVGERRRGKMRDMFLSGFLPTVSHEEGWETRRRKSA